jgi:hypothetical protein
MRGCESCIWFLKWKNDPLSMKKNKFNRSSLIGGLCCLLDARCSTSTKFECEHFRGRRYSRKKEKQRTDTKRRNRNWKRFRKTQYKIKDKL